MHHVTADVSRPVTAAGGTPLGNRGASGECMPSTCSCESEARCRHVSAGRLTDLGHSVVSHRSNP
jgi:hypothetical protein